jgi:2-(3-amino-3-carboxypropyl)histidine synthase
MAASYTLDDLHRNHDIELDGLAEDVADHDPSMVGLQLPDGIRDYGPALAAWLEDETGTEVVISGDPSFGACDLALQLEHIGVDLLVHFGHSKMPSIDGVDAFDVIFVPVYSKAPVEHVVREAGEQLAGKRVGLLTTTQHANKLDTVAAVLEEEGCDPLVGYGDNRVINPGQLLGCNFTAARTIAEEIDAFLYIGSGDFHPIAAAWGLEEMPLFVADPMTSEVRRVDDRVEDLMRQRYAAIAKAQEADQIGILVGTRVGQQRVKYARGLVKLCERHGREAHLIAMDYFSPEALASFRNMGAFVNTACPRITTDDYARYDSPMLTPQELEIALGKRDWEDYLFDEFKGTKPAPHEHEDAIDLDLKVVGEDPA